VTGAGDHDQARPWDAPGDLGRQLGWGQLVAVADQHQRRAVAIWAWRRRVSSGVSGRALVSSNASLSTRSGAWRTISKLRMRLAMAAMVSSRVLPAIVTGPCRHSAGSCWLNSRGELVAKLFAEYYEPVRVEDVVHVDATT
jgi:hypothetical protein